MIYFVMRLWLHDGFGEGGILHDQMNIWLRGAVKTPPYAFEDADRRRLGSLMRIVEHKALAKAEVLRLVVKHAKVNRIGYEAALIDSDNFFQ